MAQSPNRNPGQNRPEDDDLTRGRLDEEVAGRADEDEEEFEDLDDMEEDEDRIEP